MLYEFSMVLYSRYLFKNAPIIIGLGNIMMKVMSQTWAIGIFRTYRNSIMLIFLFALDIQSPTERGKLSSVNI